MKRSHFDGYIYPISPEILGALPEFKTFDDFEFDDFKPMILVQKFGFRTLKAFQVFLQLGGYSRQILYLPISNCQSVDIPNGEVFSMPYEETSDGIAGYTLDLIKSGKRIKIANWRIEI